MLYEVITLRRKPRGDAAGGDRLRDRADNRPRVERRPGNPYLRDEQERRGGGYNGQYIRNREGGPMSRAAKAVRDRTFRGIPKLPIFFLV